MIRESSRFLYAVMNFKMNFKIENWQYSYAFKFEICIPMKTNSKSQSYLYTFKTTRLQLSPKERLPFLPGKL